MAERKRPTELVYVPLTPKQKEIIRKHVLPIKHAMRQYLKKALPLEPLPTESKNCHALVHAIIDRAVCDAHTEIARVGTEERYGGYDNLLRFLRNENGMLEWWLESTAWNNDDAVMDMLRKYADKMEELRREVLKHRTAPIQ